MRTAAAWLIVLIVTLGGLAGRERVSAGARQPTFHSSVELVLVRVTVADEQDRPISGLAKEDFVLIENGAEQPVSHFLSSDVALDVALLLDTSSSMKPLLSPLRAAAMNFVNRLKPNDRAMVVAFGNRVQVLTSLTGDSRRLADAVGRIYARDNPRLYDGLYIALGELASASQDLARRQALVVMSDGHDTTSHLRIEDVQQQARSAGVPIYPILLSETHLVATQELENRLSLFDIVTLARDTGGRVSHLRDASDLESAYGALAEDLSEQYVLGYPATSGSRQTNIVVRIPSRPGAVTRAQVGFLRRQSSGAN